MQLAGLDALVKLQNLITHGRAAPAITPIDLSFLASMPDSIRVMDLAHAGHVVMSGPIVSLALKPNLQTVMLRHCQPLVGNLGDDMARYELGAGPLL